jgi:hypothetical protein
VSAKPNRYISSPGSNSHLHNTPLRASPSNALAASAQIILFSEMLKIENFKNLLKYSRFIFFEMESPKLINYSSNMC